MARLGRFDAGGLKDFQKNLEKISPSEIDTFLESCAKELAARLLRMAVKRTPVGDYSGDSYLCASGEQHKGNKVPGKVGGTLRRGWTAGEIRKEGDTYKVIVSNPVEYASYVEFGHRTIKKNGYGWAAGHFMMTISEKELEDIAPKVLENKLKKFLGSVFHD